MKRRIIRVISILSILVFCLFGYYFLNKIYGFSIPCMFNKITGYLCPGCGITRCLFAIIECRFRDAIWYNALITILIIPFSLYVIINTILYIVGKKRVFLHPIIVNTLLVIVILFGIVRNII